MLSSTFPISSRVYGFREGWVIFFRPFGLQDQDRGVFQLQLCLVLFTYLTCVYLRRAAMPLPFGVVIQCVYRGLPRNFRLYVRIIHRTRDRHFGRYQFLQESVLRFSIIHRGTILWLVFRGRQGSLGKASSLTCPLDAGRGVPGRLSYVNVVVYQGHQRLFWFASVIRGHHHGRGVPIRGQVVLHGVVAISYRTSNIFRRAPSGSVVCALYYQVGFGPIHGYLVVRGSIRRLIRMEVFREVGVSYRFNVRLLRVLIHAEGVLLEVGILL